LTEEVAAYCADSHTIVSDEEPERDQVRYRVYFKQPHVSIFLILGDYLQCLRTALDQAVWSLIYHRTGTDSESSEFPIFETSLNANTRRNFERKTDGLSPSAIEYIESIQPYHRPDGMPVSASLLWCVHQLNRFDKHRRISVRAQFPFPFRTHFGTGFSEADCISDTDWARMISERTDYGMDVVCQGPYKHLQPEIATLVLFGDEKAGVFVNIAELGQLHNFVTDEVLVALASRIQ
jgi:hypothetical protein